MEHETKAQTRIQTNHQFGRLPKGERRVRFADSMGMELVSIFLIDLINHWYFASSHNQKALQALQAKKLTDYSHNTSIKSSNINSINKSNNHSSNTINNNSSSSNYAYHSYHNHHTTTTSTNSNTTNNNNTATCPSSQTSFICEFTQPISLLSFKERVKLNKVQLETCQINSTAGHVSVSCTIRVSNVSYDKSVIVRYTTDDWRTHTDSLASYKPGSCDGWSDRFTSSFTLTNQVRALKPGQRIIFAIKYVFDADQMRWDNNGGLNYSIRMAS